DAGTDLHARARRHARPPAEFAAADGAARDAEPLVYASRPYVSVKPQASSPNAIATATASMRRRRDAGALRRRAANAPSAPPSKPLATSKACSANVSVERSIAI